MGRGRQRVIHFRMGHPYPRSESDVLDIWFPRFILDVLMLFERASGEQVAVSGVQSATGTGQDGEALCECNIGDRCSLVCSFPSSLYSTLVQPLLGTSLSLKSLVEIQVLGFHRTRPWEAMSKTKQK